MNALHSFRKGINVILSSACAVIFAFMVCIGTITPPVGTTLFVGVKVGNVKIETVFRQLLIYFAAIFVVLMLVTYIPQLSLWLPSLMGYV